MANLVGGPMGPMVAEISVRRVPWHRLVGVQEVGVEIGGSLCLYRHQRCAWGALLGCLNAFRPLPAMDASRAIFLESWQRNASKQHSRSIRLLEYADKYKKAVFLGLGRVVSVASECMVSVTSERQELTTMQMLPLRRPIAIVQSRRRHGMERGR